MAKRIASTIGSPPPNTRSAAPAASYSGTLMKCYNQQHRFYRGIDLHARTMSLGILDASGTNL